MDNLQNYYMQLKKDQLITSRCEEIISMFLDQRMTIRLCAENMMLSKSTIHNYIHREIKERYPDEYLEIKTKLRWNSAHLCMPRKYW